VFHVLGLEAHHSRAGGIPKSPNPKGDNHAFQSFSEKSALMDSRLRGNDVFEGQNFPSRFRAQTLARPVPVQNAYQGKSWANHDPRQKEEDCRP
jgi:hypothetical protein